MFNFTNCLHLNSSSVSLCSICHHGTHRLQTPGFYLFSPTGPDDVFPNTSCFQMPLQPYHCPSCTCVFSEKKFHPVLLMQSHPWIWSVSVEAVSTCPLHPALCRNENEICSEEALQRLFLCCEEGASVRVLQNKSKTQTKAGLKYRWSVLKMALMLWTFARTVLEK